VSTEQIKKKRFPALALIIGFLPSIAMMALFAYAEKHNLTTKMLVAECVFGVLCCFVSSFLLLLRKTVLAIVTGVLLMLLNGAISFFFGCNALLINMKF
jgi:hypothetical protein